VLVLSKLLIYVYMQKLAKKDPPLCSKAHFQAPGGSQSKISQQAQNAGQAFVSVAEKIYFGGDTELTEATTLGIAIGQLSFRLVQNTVQYGVNDISLYQHIGGHLINAPMSLSLINWSALQVPWNKYGANKYLAPQVLCNFFQATGSGG